MANTEMQYVKNRIAKLEKDFAAFASLLIQANIVSVVVEDGEKVFAVNKVLIEDDSEPV
jgi:hypothetical protein